MRELERRVLLSVLDRKWREHLYEMDYLREGIYLRAYSQRDPLVEYQREGFDMFAAMMDGIKEESVGFLFNLEVSVDEEDDDDEDEVEVEEPLRRVIGDFVADADDEVRPTTRWSRPARPSSPTRSSSRRPRRSSAARRSGPRGSSRPASRRTSPTRRPTEDGEAEVKGATVTDRRRPVRQGRPQRAVPLRLRQEVQDVPRPPRRPDRPDRARRRRLTQGARDTRATVPCPSRDPAELASDALAAWGRRSAVWSRVRHRRLQALSLVALAALLTTSLCLGPLYQRAMEQALAGSVLAGASPDQKAIRLTSDDLAPPSSSDELPARLDAVLHRPDRVPGRRRSRCALPDGAR